MKRDKGIWNKSIEQPNYCLKHFAWGELGPMLSGQRTDKPKGGPVPMYSPKNR